MNDPIASILTLVIFLYSVVLHEVAHGFMARSLGDQTAEHAGRLTLNPFKHLDLVGSVALPFFLYIIGSPFLFGYAKPVPYNPNNLSDRKYGPSKVALAGPATNIIVAVLAAVVIRVFHPDPSGITWYLINFMVQINIVLAVFNLMPIPPLDGHWLLMRFLPARWERLKIALYQYQWILIMLFIFFIFPLFFPLLEGLTKLLTGQSLF